VIEQIYPVEPLYRLQRETLQQTCLLEKDKKMDRRAEPKNEQYQIALIFYYSRQIYNIVETNPKIFFAYCQVELDHN
jgi:hypothetical protein